MAYPWANDLLFRATGNTPPPRRPPTARGDGTRPVELQIDGLDALWRRAEQQVPGWRSITLRFQAAAGKTVAFSIDQGDRARPDLRSQLTLDRGTVPS